MAGSTSTKSKTTDVPDEAATTEDAAAAQQADVENARAGADEMRSALEREQDRGEAHLIGVTDSVAESLYDVTDGETLVKLKQDVIEEFRYPGTARPAYRVLYTKGQVVQKAAIDAYNAATEARQKTLEGAAALAAYVDSTTLASGTSAGVGALEAQADSKDAGSK